tara:strand:+ start:217 stop:687 length:471 start_codon:yes stop_codon:yes gene_type:complete
MDNTFYKMKHKLIRKHTGKEFDCLNEIWDFIEIKESSIENAGLGVFAIEDIPKNILLTWYKGFYTDKSINKSYTWNFNSDIDNKHLKIEADLCVTSNPLAFVNSFANKKQEKLKNLIKVVINNRLYYKTIKKINKGTELIVDYESEEFKKYFKNKK